MSSAISIFDSKNKKSKYKHNVIYCGNCGEKNHIFKHCTQPIISLGVVLFKYNRTNNEIKYLLIRRKDSIGYVEFIRGKYVSSDIKYIKKIISDMSQLELSKLLNNDFEKLWKDLWMDGNKNNNSFRRDFNKAIDKFNKIKGGYILNNTEIILEKLILENSSQWEETEWGLPKGRRNIRENDIQAAEREFKEETSIDSSDYIIYKNNKSFEEEYIGSNNVKYKHIYYLAKYLGNKNITIDKNNLDQIKEISDINFFTLLECEQKIRPYYSEKINTLKQVEKYIRENSIYNINSMLFQNKYNRCLSKNK